MLLGKGVYPYEYMDNWKKFNETLLSEKEEFYSNLNMEDIRRGICHAICWYRKANNKFMKDYDRNKESLYLKHLDKINFYSSNMSQKFSVKTFERIKDTFLFNEDFIKSYNEESDEGYFLEIDVQYPEEINKRHNDWPFFPGTMKKLKKLESFLLIYKIKQNTYYSRNKFKESIKSRINSEKSS